MDFTKIYHTNRRLRMSVEDAATLKSLEEEIEQLAEAKIEGQPNVEEDLAGLIDSAPNTLKNEIGKIFGEKLEEVRSDMGLDASQELTPEQVEMLRQLREREEIMVAHMLSRESLRKIRAMFINKPEMIHAVMSMTQELHEKGIIGIGKANPALQPTTPDVPTLVNKDGINKDAGRDR